MIVRALLRNEGETVTEDMKIAGIDWKTGEPLTNAKHYGGPYKLVEDYEEPVEIVEETD